VDISEVQHIRDGVAGQHFFNLLLGRVLGQLQRELVQHVVFDVLSVAVELCLHAVQLGQVGVETLLDAALDTQEQALPDGVGHLVLVMQLHHHDLANALSLQPLVDNCEHLVA